MEMRVCRQACACSCAFARIEQREIRGQTETVRGARALRKDKHRAWPFAQALLCASTLRVSTAELQLRCKRRKEGGGRSMRQTCGVHGLLRGSGVFPVDEDGAACGHSPAEDGHHAERGFGHRDQPVREHREEQGHVPERLVV
eukprot:2193040-Rhodomonas_salina.2